MEQLTVKQYLAITHLARGATNKEAADATGCSESSVEKWKRRGDFQSLLKVSVRRIHDASIADLASSALDASRELKAIINNPDTSDRVKIAAIQVLFGRLENARNWENEIRIDNLEMLINANEENSTTRKALSKTANTNGFKP